MPDAAAIPIAPVGQFSVALSLSLRGAGLVNVSVTTAGMTSNVGQIYIN